VVFFGVAAAGLSLGPPESELDPELLFEESVLDDPELEESVLDDPELEESVLDDPVPDESELVEDDPEDPESEDPERLSFL
jgi:hypothetical protein